MSEVRDDKMFFLGLRQEEAEQHFNKNINRGELDQTFESAITPREMDSSEQVRHALKYIECPEN